MAQCAWFFSHTYTRKMYTYIYVYIFLDPSIHHFYSLFRYISFIFKYLLILGNKIIFFFRATILSNCYFFLYYHCIAPWNCATCGTEVVYATVSLHFYNNNKLMYLLFLYPLYNFGSNRTICISHSYPHLLLNIGKNFASCFHCLYCSFLYRCSIEQYWGSYWTLQSPFTC